MEEGLSVIRSSSYQGSLIRNKSSWKNFGKEFPKYNVVQQSTQARCQILIFTIIQAHALSPYLIPGGGLCLWFSKNQEVGRCLVYLCCCLMVPAKGVYQYHTPSAKLVEW